MFQIYVCQFNEKNLGLLIAYVLSLHYFSLISYESIQMALLISFFFFYPEKLNKNALRDIHPSGTSRSITLLE